MSDSSTFLPQQTPPLKRSEKSETLPALRLLNRPPNPAYIATWTELLAQHKQDEEKEGGSVIIFRLGKEWLAITTLVFCRIIPFHTVHSLPHHTNDILLGVVNFEGQITLCINMHRFLLVEDTFSGPIELLNSGMFKRMIAIQNQQERWIFPVDDIYGIFQFESESLENIPVNIKKSSTNYLRGIIPWNGKSVGYLDEQLIFDGLRRSIL